VIGVSSTNQNLTEIDSDLNLSNPIAPNDHHADFNPLLVVHTIMTKGGFGLRTISAKKGLSKSVKKPIFCINCLEPEATFCQKTTHMITKVHESVSNNNFIDNDLTIYDE
jgi:hypothetical protein